MKKRLIANITNEATFSGQTVNPRLAASVTPRSDIIAIQVPAQIVNNAAPANIEIAPTTFIRLYAVLLGVRGKPIMVCFSRPCELTGDPPWNHYTRPFFIVALREHARPTD